MKKSFIQLLILLSGCFLGSSAALAKEGPRGGTVIAGPDDAPLTIEEYVDFECVYCAKGALNMKSVLQDYKGKVRLVLRNMPLPFHDKAEVAAKAFIAVWLQNPALADRFQESIFENQPRLKAEGESFLVELAKQLEVNVPQMKEDMEGKQVADILAKDQALAKAYNFKGTPSFRIGRESLVGSRDSSEFRKVIDRQLALKN